MWIIGWWTPRICPLFRCFVSDVDCHLISLKTHWLGTSTNTSSTWWLASITSYIYKESIVSGGWFFVCASYIQRKQHKQKLHVTWHCASLYRNHYVRVLYIRRSNSSITRQTLHQTDIFQQNNREIHSIDMLLATCAFGTDMLRAAVVE